MWAIGFRFLTGNCVATDPGDREAAEWPPHPLRAFMALAAAHFETQGGVEQRRALEWLESLDPPAVFASLAAPRTVVTAFVPVNDGKGGESMPKVRSRQPRTFPTVVPHSDVIYYVWTTEPPQGMSEPLESLLHNVSRLGHSSSLVQAWLQSDFRREDHAELLEWIPDGDAMSGRPMRRAYEGALRQLEAMYNQAEVQRHADLTAQIAKAKGKAKKSLQELLQTEFAGRTPVSRRPELRFATRYRQVAKSPEPEVRRSVFDDELLILSQFEGPVLGSETTLRVAAAMRGAIFSTFSQPGDIPEWLGGHAPDGSPSQRPHLAVLPLPFVGSKYADGHLLGLALAFPREISAQERSLRLGKLFTDPGTGDERAIELRLGNLGEASFRVERRTVAPSALTVSTWTGPSTHWATVTPVVLDRFPKSDRVRERRAWIDEVSAMIAVACQRIGLPEPNDIAVHHNAFIERVPSARPVGGGFPEYRTKNGKGARCMVHAALAFDRPVVGPVLLGAGRYVGYGFCKPLPLKTTPRLDRPDNGGKERS